MKWNLQGKNESLVEAYRSMMSNVAWGDLINELEGIKRESIADEDSIPTSSLTIASMAEARGIRKGLDTLLRRIQDKIE